MIERIRRILVPTDFSQHAHLALKCASGIALRYGAGVDVLHAKAQGSPLKIYSQRADTEATETALLAELEKCLNVLRGSGVTDCRGRVLPGSPARTILRVAQDGEHQLIIMATHGGTGFADTLIGSCTERVVRRSSTPVLVLPSPRELLEEDPWTGEGQEGLFGWVTGSDNAPGALAMGRSLSNGRE